MPPGTIYIVSNEAAERFSFYGMKAILIIFLQNHMRGSDGQPIAMSEAEAREYYHLFVMASYGTPLLGALLAEVVFGKYATIMGFSLVYCGGHLALGVSEAPPGVALGLGLIALGAGGIKPCVSANLGDQFGSRNQHLVSGAFSYFYIAINLGAFLSTLITPPLLANAGSHIAFGVPGVLMAIATLVFWCGRSSYTHVPPWGRGFLREACTRRGGATIGRLCVLYLFVAVFWSLYDQTSSAWCVA